MAQRWDRESDREHSTLWDMLQSFTISPYSHCYMLLPGCNLITAARCLLQTPDSSVSGEAAAL